MGRTVTPGAVALVSLTLAAGCPPAQAPLPVPERPNVLLITVDTLRWDRTSVADPTLDTTPFVETWSRRATVFERSYSTSSWTVPAIASLLTGLDPAAHGVVHGSIVDGTAVAQDALAAEHRTLAERLRQRGYRTFAVTSNAHLQPELGFGQGFDRFEGLGFRPARAVNHQVRAMLGEIHSSEPWFVWVHYFDPHAPYRGDPERLRSLELSAHERERLNAFRGMTEPAEFFAAGIEDDPGALEWVSDLYDDEVRKVDAAVAELFEMLDVTSQELVVLTADHGEELLDHGGLWHGHTLYEELVRVPLIVRFPGRAPAGRRVEATAVITDIVPTVMARVGGDLAGPLHGLDLRSLAAGTAPPRSIRLATRKTIPLEGLVDGEMKLIRRLGEPGSGELYRLTEDPGERRDLAGIHPSAAAHLRDTLAAVAQRHRRDAIDAERVALSPERVDELRSVGYLAAPDGRD